MSSIRFLSSSLLLALGLVSGCSGTGAVRRNSAALPEVLRLHHVLDGELGNAVDRREVVVPLQVSGLEKGQRFACSLRPLALHAMGSAPRLRATLSAPEQSRLCHSPQSGESYSLSCAMPEERLAVVRLQVSLTERNIESLRFSLLCVEYPRIDAPAAVPSAQPAAAPEIATAPHAQPRPSPPAVRRPPPPRPSVDPSAQSSRAATSPVSAPIPVPAPQVSGHRLEIESRGRPPSPRITLVDCDSVPAFQSGATGSYRSGKRHGEFRVTDKGQCEIQLSSGVATRDELTELGPSAVLSFR